MEYVLFADTGVRVSALCMGTMTFGKEADKAAARAIFDRCREAGINFFDCANVYNKGVSEKMLGEFMADCRDELIITSKVYGDMGPSVNDKGLSRRHIMAAVEASLKRLGTDRIDLYFLHHPDKDTPMEESLEALNDLIRQGKVLYAGVSNFSAWQVMKAQAICKQEGWGRIKCIQPMYNLVKRQAEVELLPMALSENIGVVSYNPIGGGLLSGKCIKDRTVQLSHASRDPDIDFCTLYFHQTGLDLQFYHFAQDNGYHPVSLALAWVAHHPAITAPIIGARNSEQLTDSLKAVEIDMTDELYNQISALSPQPAPADDRTETPESRVKR